MPSVGFASFAQFASQVLQVCAPVRDSARTGEPRTSGRELRERERMRSRFVWIFFMEPTTPEELFGGSFPSSIDIGRARSMARECPSVGFAPFAQFASQASPGRGASSGFGAHWRAQDFWTRIA